MESILPEVLNVKEISISSTTTAESSILPHRNQLDDVTIYPKNIEKLEHVSNSGLIKLLSVVMAVALVIYGCSYCSFVQNFENEWSRVESGSGSYYELVLDIEDGEIKYSFESWLLDSTISTFDYTIIGPGMIVVDNKWNQIVFVEINGDMMTIEPSLTSGDSKEYWFK